MVGTTSFPRQHRLISKVDFNRVFEFNARASDVYFTVLARPNAAGHARLGLAVAKKAAPEAVDRNRLKRLIRESFRTRAALPALDFVVSVRAAAAAETAPTLRASLDLLWNTVARKASERCAQS